MFVVIFDVLNIFEGVVVEVYILNVYKCESFCYYFYVLLWVDGVIVGCGMFGYQFGFCSVVEKVVVVKEKVG